MEASAKSLRCRFWAVSIMSIDGPHNRVFGSETAADAKCSQHSEKALVERADALWAKRRPQSSHRQRWPPKRVSPSFRVRSLPHRIHVIASPFRHIQGWQVYCPSRCNKTAQYPTIGYSFGVRLAKVTKPYVCLGATGRSKNVLIGARSSVWCDTRCAIAGAVVLTHAPRGG